MSTLCAAINKALNVASKPSSREYSYGTAGFRDTPDDLRHAMIRCGMLAVIRSHACYNLPIGICVTASHNPEEDNGVKMVEPDGGMLVPEYEVFAKEFINSSTPFDTLSTIVSTAIGINLSTASEDYFKNCRVVLAQDTRPSSPVLAELVKLGVNGMGAQLIDVGIATTPLLHWTVLMRHDDVAALTRAPVEFHQAYYNFWLDRAENFLKATNVDCTQRLSLICDAAAGVGGPAMEAFVTAFAVFNCQMTVRNSRASETLRLNAHCGAEHVQKNRELPVNFGVEAGDAEGQACISLDGDADRVVFFTIPPRGHEKPLRTIIDGDRIAVVVSTAIVKLLNSCLAQSGSTEKAAGKTLTFGIVQTAYANGASTKFLKHSLTVPNGVAKEVVIAKTGVKNVHHEALKYDIGVYFESNGHGTVTYELSRILAWATSRKFADSPEFANLRAFLELINSCVGDAIVDGLVVVAAMRLLGLDFSGVLGMYRDLDVCQAKVKMSRANLNQLKSHPIHELHLVEPMELQIDINDIVNEYPDSRAFVRASGTEDACRVYAEAQSHESARQIADRLTHLLENYQPQTESTQNPPTPTEQAL